MSADFTYQQIEKLGNTLIYLSNGVGELNKTKILKLLYLLEENSIKKYGNPFFGFDFQVWKHGPVLKEVYIDLTEDLTILKKFIKKADYNPQEFVAAREFSDEEFSDNDIELMDIIIKFAKSKNAADLVNYTHSENSLWKKSAQKNNVLEQLERGTKNSTEFKIDFSLLFEESDFFKEKYNDSIENLEFVKHLKR